MNTSDKYPNLFQFFAGNLGQLAGYLGSQDNGNVSQLNYEEILNEYFSNVRDVKYLQPIETELVQLQNKNPSEEELGEILSALGLAYKPDPNGFLSFSSYKAFLSDLKSRFSEQIEYKMTK